MDDVAPPAATSSSAAAAPFLARSYATAATLSSPTAAQPSAPLHTLSLIGLLRFREAVISCSRVTPPALASTLRGVALGASRTHFSPGLWAALVGLRPDFPGVEGVEGVLRAAALEATVRGFSVVGVERVAAGLGVGADEVRAIVAEVGWTVVDGFVEVGAGRPGGREEGVAGFRGAAERLVRMQGS